MTEQPRTKCSRCGATDNTKQCPYGMFHQFVPSDQPPLTPVVKAVLEALPRASGFYGELTPADVNRALAAALRTLAQAGYVLLPRADVERAVTYVPNGYGEPTLPLRQRLDALLAAPLLADNAQDRLVGYPGPDGNGAGDTGFGARSNERPEPK